MTTTPVIALVDRARMEKWREAAAYLRDLADQIEAGDISDLVVVHNNVAENFLASFGEFEDRWRLLGALEYAKAGVK